MEGGGGGWETVERKGVGVGSRGTVQVSAKTISAFLTINFTDNLQ